MSLFLILAASSLTEPRVDHTACLPAGDIVTYDKKASGTCKQITKFRCDAVTLEWSPCGRQLLAATVAPRLRVDNRINVFTYYGGWAGAGLVVWSVFGLFEWMHRIRVFMYYGSWVMMWFGDRGCMAG